MTNPMLAELDAVVPVAWICDAPDDGVRTAVVAKALADMCERNGWKITPLYDHATLADMAKRLEAAERDAARYRWLRDHNNVIGEDGITECPVEIFIHGESHAPGHLDAQVDAAIDATQEGEG